MKLVKSRLLNCTFHSQRSPSGRSWCWLETPCSSNPQSLQVHSTSSSRMLGCHHWHFSRAKGFRQFCLTSSTAWRQLCRHSHGSSSTMERALRTQRRSSPTTWSGRPLATGLWRGRHPLRLLSTGTQRHLSCQPRQCSGGNRNHPAATHD